MTLIGSTGKKLTESNSSRPCNAACYDSDRQAVLWARYDASNYFNPVSEIVAVDVTSGTATSIGNLTSVPQLTCLYTPVSFSPEAPGAVTDLTATNNGTDNNVTVSFTMPTMNYGGTELNPNLQGLTYTVSVDGTPVIENKASAVGAEVTETFETTPGTHTVTVLAAQTLFGAGPESKTSLFVGMDTPAAPKNLKAKAIDDLVTLTWEAPEGQNGGKYDASKLTYKVVRMPDEVTVAENLTETTFSETIAAEQLTGYSYRVINVYDGAEGASAESGTVFVGPSFEVTPATPYIQDFQSVATAEESGFFFSGKCALPGYGYSEPVMNILSQDDNKYLQITPDPNYSYVNNPKLFTTALKLKARHTYRIHLKFRANYTYGASFAVVLADKPTADSNILKTIVENKSYGYPDENPEAFTEDRFTPTEFQVDETGVYFISMQTVNGALMSSKWDFDDVKVEDLTEPGIPNTPVDLTAEAPEGSRDVTLTFTLPTEDNNGDDPALTEVEIKRDDVKVASLTEGLTAGAHMTWTDENAPLGNHTYAVVAVNANGSSAPVQASVKVGRDYDLSITAVEAPASVVKGRPFTISATLRNNGINPAPLGEDTYTLALVRSLEGGATEIVEAREGARIESDKEEVFTFDLNVPRDAGAELTYYFYLTYEPDMNTADNRSADYTLSVITPEFPAPTTLAAEWNDGKYDLTWTAPAYDADIVTLKGYDVYCNGSKLNGEEPVSETGYSAEAESDVTYEYYVVAVYDLGTSEASEKLVMFHTGVDAAAEAAAFSVRAEGTALTVTGAEGPVAVYSASGLRVAYDESRGQTVTFPLAAGAYIVTANGHAVKIIL